MNRTIPAALHAAMRTFKRMSRRPCTLIATAALALLGVCLPSAAQISFVSDSAPSPSSSAVSTLTVSRPGGVVAGDVMVALVAYRGGNTVSVSTVPTGWTAVTSTNDSALLGMRLYQKVAGVSEPADYTWTLSNSALAAVAILAFRGVNTTSPVLTFGTQINVASTSLTAPSITPGVANSMLVAFWGANNGGLSVSPPGSMTERVDRSTGGGTSGLTLAGAYEIYAPTTATGTRIATVGTSARNTGYLIALRPSCGPTFTVTNTSNTGAGSLQQAITDANACPGLNTIAFNVTGAGCSGGVCTISPTSALPTITDTVVIDGWTQPGWIGAPIIELNGASAGGTSSGLTITAGGSTVRGIVINRFGRYGIDMSASGSGNVIAGNYIGTNTAGSAALANGNIGIVVGGNSTTIGGTASGAGNLVSGNGWRGIVLTGSNNTVQGNTIGLGADGSTVIRNGSNGVSIEGGSGNLIGGATAAARNVISGNDAAPDLADGIWITNSSNNTIQGNYIGTDATGTLARPNYNSGIAVWGTNNTIGGTNPGEGNLIAFNPTGVIVTQSGATGNRVLGNSIFSNTGLGIDLGIDGVTANNGAKTTGQPNLLMDFPVFSAATLAGTSLTVSGFVGSAPNQTTFANSRVEVFIADTTSAGNGEGRTYLGFVTTDANGNFSGTLSGVSGVTSGTTRITGTATDTSNNTSEFGPNFLVGQTTFTVSGTVFEDVNYGGGNGRNRATAVSAGGSGRSGARVELYDSTGAFVTSATTDGTGAYAFNAVNSGTYTVRVVNQTVTSARTGYVSSLRSVQTFRTNASSGTSVDVYDFVGGQNPALIDAGSNTTNATLASLTTGSNTPQSITTVTGTTGTISGVDFGYSFNVIVRTANTGQGTLRQFITNANALSNTGLAISGRTAGIDHAVLMISNGTASAGLRSSLNYFTTTAGSYNVATITPTSALPTISQPVVIDAQTQPGWTGAPIIELNGSGAGGSSNGLRISAGSSIVRGLVINRFLASGILLETSGSNIVAGCYIGTNAAGTAASANSLYGVQINNVPGNTIGGTSSAQRNVISGNTDDGIYISGASAVGNLVSGNFIGLNAAGTAVIGNTSEGLTVSGAVNTVIGGTAAGAGNVIGGSSYEGIWLINGATGTVIQGNFIGTDPTGTLDFGNNDSGIGIGNTGSASNNTVGGTVPGAGNVIAFNRRIGVAIDKSASGTATGNAVLGNSIHSNTGLGIDIDDPYASPSSPGVTPNDAGDTDTGGNNRQNFPVLTSASVLGGNTTITGTLNSAASASFRIEFFSSPTGDSTGHGEAQTYRGFANVTTDAGGNASFAATLTGVSVTVGHVVSATATDAANNTSEFAQNVTAAVGSGYAISGTVFEDVNYGGGIGRNRATALTGGGSGRSGARVELYDIAGAYVSSTTTDVNGAYSFASLAAGTYTVRVVNETVSSARTGYVASLRAVQTFRTDASSGAAADVYDFVGGQTPNLIDAASNTTNASLASLTTGTTTAQSIATVALGAGNMTGVDFGFSFNTVSSVRDSGAGSLRQVITNANALGGDGSLAVSGRTAGIEHVIFMIGNGTGAPGLRAANNDFVGGAATINPVTLLPIISASLVLDAQTQPGWTATPVVALDRTAGTASDGLIINSGTVTVRGLSITRFANDGIDIDGGTGHIIQGNYIGLRPDGVTAAPNTQEGISIDGGSGHLIGGTAASHRNVLSANGDNGIEVTSGSTFVSVVGNYIGTTADGAAGRGNGKDGVRFDDNDGSGSTVESNLISGNGEDGITIRPGANAIVVRGNLIGTNAAGTAAIANSRYGIEIASSSNTIGGSPAAQRNVVSGNGDDGIRLAGSSATGNVIAGNYVGTDALGSAAIPNADDGIDLDSGAGNNTIGPGNAVSGNLSNGIEIDDSTTSGNVVIGNIVGRNAASTANIPNGDDGIDIDSAVNNTIGGTTPGAGNLIAGNAQNGVQITSAATGNAVLGNSIFGNGLRGIDLGDNGVTANDGIKISGQPNVLMDFPMFTSASWDGTVLRVRGYVGTAAGQTTFGGSRVEVFISDNDASGFGEGQYYIGATTADANGNFGVTLTPPGGVTVAVGAKVTGTATDSSNNTSEFSANFNLREYMPFRNGSFEDGNLGAMTNFGDGSAWIVPAVSTAIDYWVVGAVPINAIPSTYWNSSHAVRSIELNDSGGAGSIEQTFDTEPGATYSVFFDYAGSAACGPTRKSLRVSAAGVSQDVTDYLIGGSAVIPTTAFSGRVYDVYYDTGLFRFTAVSDLTTLKFESLNGTVCGPIIDNVRVAAADPFVNGSFESASVSPGGTFVTLPAADTSIAAWTVGADSIDYAASDPPPSQGARAVALNGNAAGSVAQTFDAIPGAYLRARFDFATSPAGPAGSTIQTTAAGTAQDYSQSAGAAWTWTPQSFEFLPQSEATTLSFSSLTAGATGPAIDNVVIEDALPFINGSFEDVRFPLRNSTDLTADNKLVRGWVTSGAGLQHWGTVTFAPSLGSYSMHLNGPSGAGTLSQTFDVTPGQSYDMLFDAAANPALAADQSLQATVTDGGTTLATRNVTLNPSNVLPGQTRWRTQQISFTPTSSRVTINFAGQTAGNRGLVLDNVRFGVAGTLNTTGQFNAFEPTTPANAINGVIKTKLVGVPFSLDLAAIRLDKTGYSNYPMNGIKVELINAADNSAPLDELTNCRASWTSVTTVTTGFALAGADNGRKALSFTVADAYRNLRLKISYPGSGTATVTGCSNDNFAVRPASFAGFAATDNDDSSAGTARVLDNAGAGGVVHRAGRPFTVIARAVDGGNNTVTSYDGAPQLAVVACVVPTGCTAGTLAGSATTTAGSVTGNAFTYSEAGSISVQLEDAMFADADAGDSTQDERAIRLTAPATIGRFVADRYRLTTATSPTMAHASCGAGPGAQTFTFVGQNFGFAEVPVVRATPLNAAGIAINNARPVFGASHVGSSFVAVGAPVALGGSANIGNIAAGADALITFAASSFSFTRDPNTPIASFAPTFTLTVNVADTSESGATGPINSDAPLAIAGIGFAGGTGNNLHYGRLILRPAYADLRSDIYLPLEVQRHTGLGWQALLDAGACVSAATSAFAYSQATGLLNGGAGTSNCTSRVLNDVTTAAGRASIRLPKPAGGAVPSAMTVTLNTGTASGTSCSGAGTAIAATSANLPWLAGAAGAAPSARVTWGAPRSDYLMLREKYD